MAGEWIKMRGNLLTDCKVAAIARFLESDPAFIQWFAGENNSHRGEKRNENVTVARNARVTVSVTVASLLSVWSSINGAIKDGDFVPNLELDDLDTISGVPSFGRAMESVGWVVSIEPNGLVFPNFNDNNVPERDRAITNSERQKKYRDQKKAQKQLENVAKSARNEIVTKRNESNDKQRRAEKSRSTALKKSRKESSADSAVFKKLASLKLNTEDLGDDETLCEVHQSLSNGLEAVLENSEADLQRVFAAAEHALDASHRKNKPVANPFGLFVRVIQRGDFSCITQDQEDRAAKRIANRNRAGPTPREDHPATQTIQQLASSLGANHDATEGIDD